MTCCLLLARRVLQSNGGIVVNGLFEAVNGVYAAGGAASFFDPTIGRRRIGSHDHCVNSGLYAGMCVCEGERERGGGEQAPRLPCFAALVLIACCG